MKKEIEIGINHLKSNDHVLSELIDKIGTCLLAPSNSYFISLLRSIVSQQLSVKAAKTIFNNFIANFDNISASEIAAADCSVFRKAGISERKKGYIRDLAIQFPSIPTDDFEYLPDEEIISILTKINGIGRWSSEMFLIFSLNRLDVLPLKDIGLRNAIQKYYNFSKAPSDSDIKIISAKWIPYRTIAVWYLWQAKNKNV